jgi:hypothetical protein
MFRQSQQNRKALRDSKGKGEEDASGVELNEIKREEALEAPDAKQQADFALNRYQRQALRNIHAKRAGLTKEHFRNREWFDSVEHVIGLNLALAQAEVKESLDEIFDALHAYTTLQLRALLHGWEEWQIKGLNPVQLQTLTSLSSIDGLRKDMIGVPAKSNLPGLLRERQWFNHEHHFKVLQKMVARYGYSYAKSIDSLQGLSEFQLQALRHGMEYGLEVDDVRNKDWLSDEEKVNALLHLLVAHDKEKALAFCDDVEHTWQLRALCNADSEKEVDEILRLHHPVQLLAVEDLGCYGLRMSDFADNKWFSSEYHLLILKHLVEAACTKVHKAVRQELMTIRQDFVKESKGKTDKEVENLDARLKKIEEDYVGIEANRYRKAAEVCLRAIARITPLQAQVMFYRKYSHKNKVIHLNEFQARAIIEIKHPRLSSADVENQHWLYSEERLTAFKYLLRDNRINGLPHYRHGYEIVCNKLSTWTDKDFANVVNNPQPNNGMFSVPEVGKIIDEYKRAQEEEQRGKCTVL